MVSETVIDFPSSMVSVHAVRSTLLQASVGSLRIRNHFDRYRALLPREHHDAVLQTLAPVWLPIEHAIAHYEACERLELAASEQVDIGADVGRRVQRSSLSTIVRASKAAGVTPWLGLHSLDRLWTRLMQGGGTRVVRMGPKDARVVLESVPLARFEYFRNGFHGLVLAAGELFSRRFYVRTVQNACSASRLEYRLSWV